MILLHNMLRQHTVFHQTGFYGWLKHPDVRFCHLLDYRASEEPVLCQAYQGSLPFLDRLPDHTHMWLDYTLDIADFDKQLQVDPFIIRKLARFQLHAVTPGQAVQIQALTGKIPTVIQHPVDVGGLAQFRRPAAKRIHVHISRFLGRVPVFYPVLLQQCFPDHTYTISGAREDSLAYFHTVAGTVPSEQFPAWLANAYAVLHAYPVQHGIDRLALECAALHIPCITPQNSFGGRVCFPDLQIESPWDYAGIRAAFERINRQRDEIIAYADTAVRQYTVEESYAKLH